MRWTSADGQFFVTVDIDGGRDVILPQDIVSLTVTEELERMPTGSLTLNDPTHSYPRLVPRGAILRIGWGYAMSLEEIRRRATVGDVFDRGISRRGFRAWVTSPSGGGNSDGSGVYNCNFVALDFRGSQDVVVWESGTKADVVRSVFGSLGVAVTDVLFERGNESVTEAAPIRQAETGFSFLARCAREWRAVLLVGYSAAGVPVGVFVDPWRISRSLAVASIAGRPAQVVGLSYKFGNNPNVLSYAWKHSEGESGVGDSTTLEWVNGELVTVRRVIEADRVRTWRLSQDRINAEFARRGAEGGLTAQAEFTVSVLQAQRFEEVERFFDEVELETAPNGIGWTINCRVFGDISLVPGTGVRLNEGFPDMFTAASGGVGAAGQTILGGNRPVDFLVRRNTHSVSDGGYFSELEIVDVYTLSPTGLSLIGGGPI